MEMKANQIWFECDEPSWKMKRMARSTELEKNPGSDWDFLVFVKFSFNWRQMKMDEQ